MRHAEPQSRQHAASMIMGMTVDIMYGNYCKRSLIQGLGRGAGVGHCRSHNVHITPATDPCLCHKYTPEISGKAHQCPMADSKPLSGQPLQAPRILV